MTAEERLAIMRQTANDCMGKEGAADGDLQEVLARKLPTTKGSKCIHACIQETMGFVKDNKFNSDGAIDIVTKVYNGDEKAVAFIKEIATECSAVTDADRCELASKLVSCVMDGVVKRGVDPATAV